MSSAIRIKGDGKERKGSSNSGDSRRSQESIALLGSSLDTTFGTSRIGGRHPTMQYSTLNAASGLPRYHRRGNSTVDSTSDVRKSTRKNSEVCTNYRPRTYSFEGHSLLPQPDSGSLMHPSEIPVGGLIMPSLIAPRQHPQGRLEKSQSCCDNDKISNSIGNMPECNSESDESIATSKRPKDADAATMKGGFIYCLVYAAVNSIMCIPCLYGYASVIFNHDVFQPQIAAFSKLVIFSSMVHQVVFCIFSTLPFAIGQVQDAGLIFLSAMSNKIANSILEDGGTQEEVVSTTIVTLSLATASLGVVLMLMGRFRLADVVAYLPLPVVGGYLAFIGYFCLEAGISLCISQTLMGLSDWGHLFHKKALVLAIPGLLAGIALTCVSRFSDSNTALPIAMLVLPIAFYFILFIAGLDLDDARQGGWVGEAQPPVSVSALFDLVDLGKVRWKYMSKCIPTWAGMVFVVSFSSCLDVAAISMDMGEALDVNMELMTVGISNLCSGLMCGQTGSYIFSQTIFTYRTGCHSRWVGILVAFSFVAVVITTVNFLQITPLFFLGSTLIFIGFDLIYEWLIEIRHKLLLTEYLVLLATFVAIQLVGIDGGIGFGVAVAVVDYVVTNAKVTSLNRVLKRSLAVWTPDHWKILQDYGYHKQQAKIMSLEVKGSVFFGSSLQLLTSILEEIGINASSDDIMEISIASPRPRRGNSSPAPLGLGEKRMRMLEKEGNNGSNSERKSIHRHRPRFVVLDLSQVPIVDASAARGCFLQLVKMCSKREIIICASGANMRVDWMLRSHEVAYTYDEEVVVKSALANPPLNGLDEIPSGKLILFETLYEALELCEHTLIQDLERHSVRHQEQKMHRLENFQSQAITKTPLSTIFGHVLGIDGDDARQLHMFDSGGTAQVEEIQFDLGDIVITKDTVSDAFYVVLSGAVAVFCGRQNSSNNLISGAGSVRNKVARQVSHRIAEKAENLGEVRAFLQVGGIFGHVDYMLKRPRSFSVASARDGTVVATLSRVRLEKLKAENPYADRIVEQVLLQTSLIELANLSAL